MKRALPPRLIVVVSLFAGSVLLLCGCTSVDEEATTPLAASPPRSSEASSAALEKQMIELLSEYSLKPDGSFDKQWLRMPAKDNLPLALYVEASRGIGLDPTPWAGREVWVYSTKLDQEMLEGGSATAHFLVGDGAVVGAHLSIEDLIPGVVALDNREYFAPPKLTPRNLDFTGARQVKVIGPWTGSDWTKSATLTGARADDFLSLLAKSSARRGERFGIQHDEEYMFIVTFANGSVVRARLTTKKDGTPTFVTFDSRPYANWYYVPPEALKPRVKSLLGL